MFSVMDYAPKRNGVELDNEAFQAAIDACSAAGGGTVFVPAFTYKLSSVILKDNVTLRFEDGTVLLGSEVYEDYLPDEPINGNIYQDVSHTCYQKSMFYANGAKNIGLCGRAILEMRAIWDEKDERDNTHRGPKSIAFLNCRGVTLTDLHIRNTTDICVMLGGCDDVLIERLDLYVIIDGISPDSCRNVTIRDCNIVAGDDGIVLKTSNVLGYRRSMENVTVRNCTVSSRCSALKFGTETYGDMKNISFENCVVRNTRLAGIAIESVDGSYVENVVFRNIRMENVTAPLFMKLGKRQRAPEGEKRPGRMKNITVENLLLTGPYEEYDTVEVNYSYYKARNRHEVPRSVASSIVGLADNPIENVTLRNIHMEVMGGYTGEPLPTEFDAKETDYPESTMYGYVLPAYGLILKNAENVTMENVDFKPLSPDNRPMFLDESNKRGK